MHLRIGSARNGVTIVLRTAQCNSGTFHFRRDVVGISSSNGLDRRDQARLKLILCVITSRDLQDRCFWGLQAPGLGDLDKANEGACSKKPHFLRRTLAYHDLPLGYYMA